MKIEIFNLLPGSRPALPIGDTLLGVLIVSRCRVCVQLSCHRNDFSAKF